MQQYPPPQWSQQSPPQQQWSQQSQSPYWGQQSPQPPTPAPQKWYRTNVGIIFILIIFFPAGLYLMWRYARWPKSAKWIVTALFAFFMLIEGIVSASTPQSLPSQTRAATQQATSGPANTTTSASTPTAQVVHYPPKTEADLHALTAAGDASAIHEFHSESVGLTGVCPQSKRLVTVSSSITGKKLTEDLLAYFYSEHLDSPCGSIVFVYHNQGEANDTYTAGRINFDATDASGQENVDPNATSLKYTLTLDVGGLSNQTEYVVTY